MSGQLNVQSLWLQGGGKDPLNGRTFQRLFDSLPAKEAAFVLSDRNLRCIDEGTAGGLHLAGSGIFYPKAKENASGKVTGVYSHQNCGAVAKFVSDNHIETSDTDALGDKEAKQLAQNLNVPYLGQISARQMSRPAFLHVARAVYVALENFDPAKLPLPKGFVSSRNLISDTDYAKFEINLCCLIAFGDHGFGSLFTLASPFYIVVVSKSTTDLGLKEAVLKEAQAVAANYPRVKVDMITL